MSSSATESGKTENGIVFSKTNSYDDLGRLLSFEYNTSATNPFTVSYTYVGDSEQGTTTNLVASVDIGGKKLSYTYDEDGNITEIWENGTLKESYEYDSLNQMVRENNLDNNKTILYTYDKSGNIREKKIYAYTTEENLDSLSFKFIDYTYDDENWGDLLTAYNGKAITYDEIGNPLSYRSGMTFQWSGGRKLTSFSTPNAVGNYVYNADGIRVYKEVNGNKTEYYLNGTEIETEITNFGGITRRVDYIYDENGSIYGFVVDNTAKYYYTKNLQGDIIGILDASGTQIVEYSYDAWGKATVSYPNADSLTEAQKQANYLLGSNNPFRYRGYYFDNETGFYYLNSRYYDPEVGRFINADVFVSTGQGIIENNMFAYCLNNPAINIDASGFWAERYSGFSWTNTGFNLNVQLCFLSQSFCLIYAADIIRMKGQWYWWGKGYKKMSVTRIAQELWFHALVYYTGSPVKTILNKVGVSWGWLNSQLDHASYMEINNNDKRSWVFALVWNSVYSVKYVMRRTIGYGFPYWYIR